MRIFSKEKTNLGRQYEADLLRGFTAIILILCHVGFYLSLENSNIYYFADIIGSESGAPIFMGLMGISLAYSKHNSPKDIAKRGLKLFIVGFVLNFFRSLLPYLIVGDIDSFSSVNGFFIVDIYQFAGLALMFIGLLKKLKVPSWGILLIAFGLVCGGQILMNHPETLVENKPLSYLLQLLIPINNEYSCFPFMIWFVYPTFGLVIGEVLKHVKNKNTFYLILLLIGLAGPIVVYYNIISLFPNYNTYYYGNVFYHMGIFNTTITLLYFLFALAIWYFIGKILPKFINKYLSFLSKNLSFFYIFSWILISAIIHIKTSNAWNINNFISIILIVALIAICSVASFYHNKVVVKIKNNRDPLIK